MDNNLNALMNAANQKLDAQKKQEDAPEEDLYADMRQEMEQDEYDDIDIQRQQYDTQEEYNIQHEPDDYEDEEYIIDPNDTQLFDGGPGMSQIEIWKNIWKP